MSVEENKATIRRVIDELRKGNVGIVEEAFSPNFAYHSHRHTSPPLRGLEGARVMTTGSDLAEAQVTIEDIFGEGDRVAVRWTFRGTYRGAAKPGFPQPGERCTIVAISTYRFVDGKIEDDWGVEAFWHDDKPWG
ncbi:MAG: ester cyclase [Deltaproteobacteria bacterium]|nr:ester cyclase [Deltaproteobacteria bacterium]